MQSKSNSNLTRRSCRRRQERRRGRAYSLGAIWKHEHEHDKHCHPDYHNFDSCWYFQINIENARGQQTVIVPPISPLI